MWTFPEPKTTIVKPLNGYHPVGSTVIVHPLGDPAMIGSLYLPDDAKNTEYQQGYVVAVGPESSFSMMDKLLFHPFSAHTNDAQFTIGGQLYLRIRDHSIIAKIVGRVLEPRDGEVVVKPGWDNLGERRSPTGIWAIDPTVFSSANPCKFGMVVRCGARCYQVAPGDRVVIPPDKGQEVGWIDRILYTIPERDLLAVVDSSAVIDADFSDRTYYG